jgi:quercetin dioxygenase-like cupin family protein
MKNNNVKFKNMKKKEAKKPHVNVRFFQPEDVGPRIWGREILIAHVTGLYTGKLLLRRKDPADKKRSMQFHRVKNECSYIYSGELLFSYDAGDGKISQKKLVAGDSVHIPPGAVHGEQALTDCVIFETSNPVFNDRVRVNEQYGLPSPENSLPSTTIDEVEIR